MKLIILGVVVLGVLYVVSSYNSLISLRERVTNAMSQIAANLESRWDALTSLIEGTKQYQDFEKETLTEIISLRRPVGKDTTVSEVNEQEEAIQRALTQIDVVVEQYPNLKASEQYQTTMKSINEYENNVRFSRMSYNDTVTKYNTTIQQFPKNIIANMFSFQKGDYFKQENEEKKQVPSWGE